MPNCRSNSRLPRIEIEVFLQGLDHLMPDREERIQSRRGILKDHRDLASAQVLQSLLVERDQVDIFQPDFAGTDTGIAGEQAHDAIGDGGFSAARFADQAKDLATLQVESDIGNRLQPAAAALELGAEVAYRQQTHRLISPFWRDSITLASRCPAG